MRDKEKKRNSLLVKKKVPVEDTVDIVVVGAGISGAT